MVSHQIYVCDADCLINLHRHFGRQALSKLRDCCKNSGLKLPEGVVREIIRGTDKLAKFVLQQQQTLQVTTRQIPMLHKEIPRLEKLYGQKIQFGTQEYAGFWHSKAGRRAADAQVVGVAKLLKGSVAVSDDEKVKLACALEGVTCIGWAEFARRIGLVKTEQLQFDL